MILLRARNNAIRYIPQIDRPIFQETGLIEHWRFDTETGTSILAEISNTAGTVYNNPVLKAINSGGIKFFNGSTQYIDLSADTRYAFTSSAFSIVTRFFVGTVPGSGQLPRVISKLGGSPNYNGFELYIRASDSAPSPSRITFQIGNAGTLNLLFSDNAVTANTEYTVVVTSDGSTIRMFINGVLQVNTIAVNIGSNTATPLYVANWPGGSAFFNGGVKSLTLFNRALAVKEAANLYFKQNNAYELNKSNQLYLSPKTLSSSNFFLFF